MVVILADRKNLVIPTLTIGRATINLLEPHMVLERETEPNLVKGKLLFCYHIVSTVPADKERRHPRGIEQKEKLLQQKRKSGCKVIRIYSVDIRERWPA